MTSNLPAVILIASLVSCHPAPAMALPLASPPVAGYAGNPHPHGETGLAARYHRRTTAHSGFFVRVRPCLRYDRLGRGTFGFAGSDDRSANLVQSVTRCLAASGDGLSPIIGVTTMTTPARIPSAARQRSIKITALILLSLKTGSKTGTVELQQRIAREGIPVTLRTVQRRLAELSTVLPIEGDGNSPQGWRWKADTAATVARVAGGAA